MPSERAYALFQHVRVGLMVWFVSLALLTVAHAADAKDLTEKLPRGFIGEFRWDGDAAAQNVVFTFDKVRTIDERNAEAFGCGSYLSGPQVTTIKVRMLIRLPDLQVQIFEASPVGSANFETGGSHRGHLSDDLRRIDARWTTTASGQKGRLRLRAASPASCEPAASV